MNISTNDASTANQLKNISNKQSGFTLVKWVSLFFALSLYSVKIANFLSVADIASIFVFFYCIFFIRVIKINYFNLIYLFCVFFTFLSGLFLFEKQYFQVDGFLLSWIRFFVCVVILFFLSYMLCDDFERVACIKALCLILIVHSFIQFVFAILFYTDHAPFLNVVAFGGIGRESWLNVYDYKTYFRFGGVFEEPSWYSWFVILCLGIVISAELKNNIKFIGSFGLAIIFLGIVLTFSVAGMISFFILLYLRYAKGSINILLFAGIITLFVFSVYLYKDDFALFNRITNIVIGDDGSAHVRIFGSFLRASVVLSESLLGGGLGNSIASIFYYDRGMTDFNANCISNQNGFIEPFVSCGLIPGLLYLLPVFLLLRYDKEGRVFFITISLVFMTMSSIFTSSFLLLYFVGFLIVKGTIADK